MNVLFICTGNINRSPAAELILKAINSELFIDSAGVSDYNEGKEMTKSMQSALARTGIRVLGNAIPRSKPLTSALVEWADTILYMNRRHYERAIELVPAAEYKLRNLATLQGHPNIKTIRDPHGKGPQFYDAIVEQLYICCTNLNKEYTRE